GSYLRLVFFERSFIQHVNTFCFWATVAILVLRAFATRGERTAIEAGWQALRQGGLGRNLIFSDAPRLRAKFTAEGLRSQQGSIVFRRIFNALDRLEKTEST